MTEFHRFQEEDNTVETVTFTYVPETSTGERPRVDARLANRSGSTPFILTEGSSLELELASADAYLEKLTFVLDASWPPNASADVKQGGTLQRLSTTPTSYVDVHPSTSFSITVTPPEGASWDPLIKVVPPATPRDERIPTS